MSCIRQASRAACDAIASLHGPGDVAAGDHAADLLVRQPDGSHLALQVKTTAVPTWDWIRRLPRDVGHLLVVAGQISPDVRRQLNDEHIAWLDRRGHLRLVSGGLFIDADVPPAPRRDPAVASRVPISGRSGLAAASAMLLNPTDPMGVTEIARRSGLNPSSISRALVTLAEAHLVERVGRGRYRPLTPELFWALADVWPRERTMTDLALRDLDDPRIGLSKDPGFRGPAMAGERGALAWGAPLVLTGDYPVFVYVDDDQAIRAARAIAPSEPDQLRAAVVMAADPSGLIVSQRFRGPGDRVVLAHPLFCALDLTRASRDREALDQWEPPEDFIRVW